MDSTPADSAATAPATVGPVLRPAPLLAAVWISAVGCAIWLLLIWQVDVPLARWLSTSPLPKFLEKLLSAAEHFGTFYGQILILPAICALSPANRRTLVRIAATAWGAGLAANLVKLCVGRTRPKYFDFATVHGGPGFLDLFPFGAGGSRSQSFPSAHTATAVGFCMALSHFYPRGRWVFWTLAALVGLQRLESHSHFASDVVAGALVGWVVGTLMTGPTRLADRWDQFEAARL